MREQRLRVQGRLRSEGFSPAPRNFPLIPNVLHVSVYIPEYVVGSDCRLRSRRETFSFLLCSLEATRTSVIGLERGLVWTLGEVRSRLMSKCAASKQDASGTRREAPVCSVCGVSGQMRETELRRVILGPCQALGMGS